MANISYPGFFGRFFWYHKHLFAWKYPEFKQDLENDYKLTQFVTTQRYKLDKSEPVDDMYPFATFLKLMCANLPCGGCTIHALMYLNDHPIEEHQNNELEYTFDFHNTVNKRTSKLVLTYDKALDYLQSDVQKKRKEYEFSQPELDIPICGDFWTMLLILSFTYSNDPDDATLDEQVAMFNIVKYCFLLHPSIRSIVNDLALSSVCHFESRIATQRSLLHLHNRMAKLLTYSPPLAMQDFLGYIHEKFEMNKLVKFDHFVESRKRDHENMLALQDKIVELQGELTLQNKSDTLNDVKQNNNVEQDMEFVSVNRTAEDNWRLGFIIVLVLFVALLTFVMWNRYFRRRKRSIK